MRVVQKCEGGFFVKKLASLALSILFAIISLILWGFKLALIGLVGKIIFDIVFIVMVCCFLWNVVVFISTMVSRR